MCDRVRRTAVDRKYWQRPTTVSISGEVPVPKAFAISHVCVSPRHRSTAGDVLFVCRNRRSRSVLVDRRQPGYDIWEAGASTAQGIEGSRWMDLPTLPILMIGTFAVTGHTYASALLPMAIANTLLPALAFMTTRALGVGISMAFSAAVLLTVMPTFQFYSLGAAEPDPIFAALVMGLAWTYARALEHSSGRRWFLLGLVAALLALTRPEGPLYALTLVLFGIASTR